MNTRKPLVSEEALRFIERREEESGVRFSALVREWYSLDGPVEKLANNEGNSVPIPLARLGNPKEANWGWLHVMDERDDFAYGAVYVFLRTDREPPEAVLFRRR
jgi:hypothetical protein